MRTSPLICALVLVACSAPGSVQETRGGSAATADVLEDNLRAARATWKANPSSEEAAIWVGRRLGYLGRYEEAIDWYTARLSEHPASYRLLRHRGHRYISVREFEKAVRDLERAAELIADVPDEIEPDGAPNAAGIPRSTTHSNIYYHLGLAHYLLADYESALVAYEHGMIYSQVNDDMLVATSNWLYATLRRLGLEDRARATLEPIHADMDLVENFSYWKLLRLYKGEIGLEEVVGGDDDAILSATVAYGIGNYHFMNGETERALEVWADLAEGGARAAFGTIAAEADLERFRGSLEGP